MAETLFNCPFCGGEAKFEIYGGACSIVCQTCQCGTPVVRFGDGMSIIERWNRRAERTCHVATKERRFSQTQTLVTKSCSACGYAFGDEERRPILPGLDETMVLDPVDVPSYCPHCGARVVEEDS